MSGDIDGVEKFLEKFRDHAEHIQEVCLTYLRLIKISDRTFLNVLYQTNAEHGVLIISLYISFLRER